LLTTNRPLGASYYPPFAKGSTKVDVKTYDGYRVGIEKLIGITRKGEKKVNDTKYYVKKGSKVKRFRRASTNVPDLVASALATGDLNIREQFDDPFLIMSSGGEFSRVINNFTGIENLNQGNQELREQVSKSKRRADELETDVRNLKRQRKKYRGLSKIGGKMFRINELREEIDRSIKRAKALKSLLEELQQMEKEMDLLKRQQRRLKLTAYDLESDLSELMELESEVAEKVLILEEREDVQLQIMEYRTRRKKLLDDYASQFENLERCPFCFSSITEDVLRNLALRMRGRT
jgi:hypothetical protein